MSDLQISLLNSDMNFDSLYEVNLANNIKVVRQELVEFQKNVDELQVLGESEIDQHNLNQLFQALKKIQLQQLNLKEKIIKLEQQSRGVEQRNKTKKLRDLYASHLQRQQQLYKNIVNDSGYEPLQDALKEIDKMMKLSSKQDVQNYNLNQQIQSKQSTAGSSTNLSQMQLLVVEPLEQYEHLDWQNQILKQNQEDVNRLQMKAQTVNKIVQDLALEIEHQHTNFDEIEKNFGTTIKYVDGARDQLEQKQEKQKSGNKKLWCMLICAFLTFLVMLLILLL